MVIDQLAFERRQEGRIVAGVAGGFADQHGLDAVVVRAALVVLAFAGGLGVVMYAAMSVLASSRPAVGPRHAWAQERNLAVGFVSAGLLLIVRSTGVWLGDRFMVPFAVFALGVAVLGDRSGSWSGSPAAAVLDGRHARVRLFVGAGLVTAGLLLVAGRSGLGWGVRTGAGAAAVTIAGVALLFGPWFARAAQEVAEARRQRIRDQEREAMAAHLHDSVLQTLALIQRNADDPRRTVTLARRQERELREWLYGRSDHATGGSLADALRATAADVEDAYDVRVEVVVVGDGPVDEAGASLVAATREACVNAAKHSGAPEIAVYAEITADRAEVFVRDRGCGFDRSDLPDDRLGVRQSIEGRIERVGGRSGIRTAPGAGTEVHLEVPRRHAEAVTAP